MLIKVLGGALIVIGAWVIGLCFAYKPFYRKSDLASFALALEILESEINNYSSIMEGFLSISKKLRSDEIGSIFFKLYEKLKERTGNNIEEIWLEILEREKNKLYINEEDMDRLKDFGGILSSFDRELEIKNINALRQYILSVTKEINDEYIKNKKMFQSVGLLGGLVIVIALL